MTWLIVAGLFLLFIFSLSQVGRGIKLARFVRSLSLLLLSLLLWPFIAFAEAVGLKKKPPPPPAKKRRRS